MKNTPIVPLNMMIRFYTIYVNFGLHFLEEMEKFRAPVQDNMFFFFKTYLNTICLNRFAGPQVVWLVPSNQKDTQNWSPQPYFCTVSSVKITVTALPMGSNFDEKGDMIIPSSWRFQSSCYHSKCGGLFLSFFIFCACGTSKLAERLVGIKVCIINDITYAQPSFKLVLCRFSLGTSK